MFTQAQKDIMVEFYNRQAVNRIREEPTDVIKAMQDAGLEALTAAQIKHSWSTYHHKNRNFIATRMPATNDVACSSTPVSRDFGALPIVAGLDQKLTVPL